MDLLKDDFIRFENDIQNNLMLNSNALKRLNELTSKLYKTKRAISNITDEASELRKLIDIEKVKIQELTDKELSIQLERIKAEVCAEDEKNNMNVYIKMMEDHKLCLSKVFEIENQIKKEPNDSELIFEDEIQRAELTEKILRAESKCATIKKRNAATLIRLTKKLQALDSEKCHYMSLISSRASN